MEEERMKLLRSFDNINETANSNIFVSIHSADPGEMQILGYPPPKFGNPPYNPENINAGWLTQVPENTIVITFAPTDKHTVSDDESEIQIRKMLSDPHWMHQPNLFTESAQLFMPGDQMYNQQMIFDDEPYWDVWHLPNRKMDITVETGNETPFKLSTRNTDPDRAADAKFHSMTTGYLIESFKGDAAADVYRIIYIWSCCPPTNTMGIGRLMSLSFVQGIWQRLGYPSAKAREIVKEIYELRNICEQQGKDQFKQITLLMGTPKRGAMGARAAYRPRRKDVFSNKSVGGDNTANTGGGGSTMKKGNNNHGGSRKRKKKTRKRGRKKRGRKKRGRKKRGRKKRGRKKSTRKTLRKKRRRRS